LQINRNKIMGIKDTKPAKGETGEKLP